MMPLENNNDYNNNLSMSQIKFEMKKRKIRSRRRETRSWASTPPVNESALGVDLDLENPRNFADYEDDPPFSSVWGILDIEPLLVLHLTAALLGHVGTQNLLVVKACIVDLGFDKQACLSIGEKTLEEEQAIQKLMTSLVMWRTIFSNLLPIILVAQIGAWSDKHGRRVPMMLVSASFIGKYTFMALSAYYRESISAWHTGVISAILSSSAGNNACFGMLIFSYIDDVTPKDKLHARISINGSCYFLGILVGLVIGGYHANTALPFIFSLATFMEIIVFLGLMFRIKNRARSTASLKTKIKDLFSPQYMIESYAAIFRERPHKKKMMLWVLLALQAMTLIPLSGDSSVEFLQARVRYNWDAAAYSSLTMFKTVIGFLAKFLSLAILNHLLNLSDPMVGIISTLTLVASSLIQAFAVTPTMAYIAPLPTLLSGSLTGALRTLIFSTVEKHETGKINSFIASLESLSPVIAAPIYTKVYYNWLQTFTGSFNLLSAVLLTIPTGMYLWIMRYMDFHNG